MDLFKEPEITFAEKEHKYHSKKDGAELISVTTLIHKFVPEFDPTGSILKKCAADRGITPEELRKEWDKTRDDACIKGTNFHSDAETFIKTGKIPKTPNADIIKQLKKFDFKGDLLSEVRVYNLDLKVAGTVDLIDFHDNTLSIYDFKTNKKLRKYGFKGETLKPPLSHFPNANFWIYAIQLNTYAYILEEAGYFVNPKALKLYYIHPETRLIETHDLPDVRDDVEKMFNAYKNFGKEKSEAQRKKEWRDSLFF